ncbi:MAG: hypothetical protein VX589_05710 [Myxococcota bacterium]|nr:hypothetical protein [Myxococcota bacterium]
MRTFGRCMLGCLIFVGCTDRVSPIPAPERASNRGNQPSDAMSTIGQTDLGLPGDLGFGIVTDGAIQDASVDTMTDVEGRDDPTVVTMNSGGDIDPLDMAMNDEQDAGVDRAPDGSVDGDGDAASPVDAANDAQISPLDAGRDVDVGLTADADVTPVYPTAWREITHEGRGGRHEWLAGRGADLSRRQPDGHIYRLHIPSPEGPGLRIARLRDDGSGQFDDLTRERLPSEWGRFDGYTSGVFIDLNDDGWSDIAVWGDNLFGVSKCFIFDVGEQRFRPIDFSTPEEFTMFFGGTPGYYDAPNRHVNVVLAEDLDGDGDEDLFLGRQNINVILENLTIQNGIRQDWGLATVRSDDDMRSIIPRFDLHPLEHRHRTVDEFRNTMAATAFAFDGQTWILAADGACGGRDGCSDQEDWANTACFIANCPMVPQFQQSMVHLYGFTGLDAPTLNGHCEIGEATMPDHPDCDNDGMVEKHEEVSFRFTDHAHRWQPFLNAISVAAVKTGQADRPIELVIFGGVKKSERSLASECFIDPTPEACNGLLWRSRSVLIPIDPDRTVGVTEPAPPALALPFFQADYAQSVDLERDGISELIVGSRATLQAGTPISLARRSDEGWRHEPPGDAHMDQDHSLYQLLVHDVDGDDLLDVLTARIEGFATLWGTHTDDGVGLGWQRRAPLQTANLEKVAFADFDLDGDLDGVTKTDTDTASDRPAMLFYLNDGQGTLTAKDDAVVWSADQAERLGFRGTVHTLDIDRDGDVDVVASQQGPLLVLENRFIPDGQLVFQDRPDWVPPWYDQGGMLVPGDPDATPPCTTWRGPSTPAEFRGNARCKGFHMAVADYDGNGGEDLAVVVPKGMNDILFNNLGGDRCGDHPWCAPRFLSARTDLRIASVLPSTIERGFGQNNQSARVQALTGELEPSAADLVIIHSGETAELRSGQRFKNQISQPFPHGIFCTEDTDCPEADHQCRGLLAGSLVDRYFSDLKVCLAGDELQQPVVNGWFTAMDGAFPGRGAGLENPGSYRAIGCTAYGDLNGDGHGDFLVATAVGDATPDLTGAFSVGPRCSATATACDQVFVCQPAQCDQLDWDPAQPHAREQQCCSRYTADSDPDKFDEMGVFMTPECFPASCQIKGNDALLTPQEAKVFVYVWHEDDQRFVEQPAPLEHPGCPGATIHDCALSDLNGDGRDDVVLAGYLTSEIPESRTARPLTLLTHPFSHERRRTRTALTTSIWLNAGTDAAGALQPFPRADLPSIADKIYHLSIVDLDGDAIPEIVTTGANNLSIYGAVIEDDARP